MSYDWKINKGQSENKKKKEKRKMMRMRMILCWDNVRKSELK